MERIRQLTSHLSSSTGSTPSTGVSALQQKRPDDVVVVMAARSPLCRQGKGAFKDVPADDLLAAFLKSTVAALPKGVSTKDIQDITLGNVLMPGSTYVLRAAALAAGIPETTPVQTLNRFCSSGLMALSAVSNRIKAGEIDIGLAIGFEAMSTNQDKGAPPISEDILSTSQAARDVTMPMGWTSENVAGDYSISREDMDKMAYLSHTRASKAFNSGVFDKEIIPVEVKTKDPKTGAVTHAVVSKDDVIRHGTELPTLLKIRSAFPQWPPSQTTGGNASQNSDGGAAVLLMRRSKAYELGLTDKDILGKHVTTSVVGVPPRVMGIGPKYAIPDVLKKTGIEIKDVDLFEINEAFASMFVYVVNELGLDVNKVNVNGGAIALGHPLARATGARQVATGLSELERRSGKVLVTSMCMGTGMGAAAVFVKDH